MTKPKLHIFLMGRLSVCGRDRDKCSISYDLPEVAAHKKDTCTVCSGKMRTAIRRVKACTTHKMSYVEAITGIRVD
jgi:hypothetical protein